jgi:glutamine synthetase
VTPVPQVSAANEIGSLIETLRAARAAMRNAIERAEGMHDALEKQAHFLSTDAADRMADVRAAADALELSLSDELWPLPKYREILFPV